MEGGYEVDGLVMLYAKRINTWAGNGAAEIEENWKLYDLGDMWEEYR